MENRKGESDSRRESEKSKRERWKAEKGTSDTPKRGGRQQKGKWEGNWSQDRSNVDESDGQVGGTWGRDDKKMIPKNGSNNLSKC